MSNFDLSSYEQCDAPAREAVSAYLSRHGYTVTDEENYGVDLRVGQEVGHELEVSRRWEPGKEYPFGSIQIPRRKQKVLDAWWVCFFWVLNRDQSEGYVVSGEYLKLAPIVTRDCGERGVDEFFDVSLDHAMLVVLKRRMPWD